MRWMGAAALTPAILALLGSAQAACRLERAVPQVPAPAYSALAPLRAALTVQVGCETPNDEFQLFLSGVQDAGQASPVLTVPFKQGSALLRATLSGNLNQLRGQVLRGSQNLTFPLDFASDQWTEIGTYQAQLSLVLLNQP